MMYRGLGRAQLATRKETMSYALTDSSPQGSATLYLASYPLAISASAVITSAAVPFEGWQMPAEEGKEPTFGDAGKNNLEVGAMSANIVPLESHRVACST